MTPRLALKDKIIHRVYGRAILRAIFYDNSQALIEVTGERAPRRVLLKDVEKEPAPLKRDPLRVVR